MATTVQMRYVFKPSTTNWGASDDRHFIHCKYFVDGYQTTPHMDPYAELLSKKLAAWCKDQFGKPLGHGSGQSEVGVWKRSSDNTFFVFKESTDAMLMKLTWSV